MELPGPGEIRAAVNSVKGSKPWRSGSLQSTPIGCGLAKTKCMAGSIVRHLAAMQADRREFRAEKTENWAKAASGVRNAQLCLHLRLKMV
jgi:hypothetical protein